MKYSLAISHVSVGLSTLMMEMDCPLNVVWHVSIQINKERSFPDDGDIESPRNVDVTPYLRPRKLHCIQSPRKLLPYTIGTRKSRQSVSQLFTFASH